MMRFKVRFCFKDTWYDKPFLEFCRVRVFYYLSSDDAWKIVRDDPDRPDETIFDYVSCKLYDVYDCQADEVLSVR